MNHRRYICSEYQVISLTPQVVFGTWRAADCRPYDNVQRFLHFTSAKLVFRYVKYTVFITNLT